MTIKALTPAEIKESLAKAPLWALEGSEIMRKFVFSGFGEAMGFVNRVAKHAEKEDHHPDILVQYNKVTLRLSTHDANGLSVKDFAFAKASDGFCELT